jgi:hypothetical protein
MVKSIMRKLLHISQTLHLQLVCIRRGVRFFNLHELCGLVWILYIFVGVGVSEGTKQIHLGLNHG